MNKHALVIGAGIHGLAVAVELAKRKIKVTLLERNHDILLGTSNATHNRAHMGYHYPRSLETARECIEGNRYFVEMLRDVLVYPGSAYYLVEKNESKVTASEYAKFCEDAGLEYKLEWPDLCMLNRDNIEASFMVEEPLYDVNILRRYYKKEIAKYDIELICDYNLESVNILSSNTLSLCSSKNNKQHYIVNLRADAIVNATYALTNNVQRMFGIKNLCDYKLQTTEVPVVRCMKNIPQLTVMNGRFVTIFPYAGYKDLYLFYDVIHSVVCEQTGKIYVEPETLTSNWELMKEHAKMYFPFMNSLEYVKSNWGTRPIPVNIVNDSRITRFKRHNEHTCFYSIMEGKFISAPIVAKQLVDKIWFEI